MNNFLKIIQTIWMKNKIKLMMQKSTLIILITLFNIYDCDAGLGTSGRDHCKNYAPVSLNGPIRTSKANKFRECIDLLNFISPYGGFQNDQNSTDLLILDCSWQFKKLKECDNESPLPNPIPIKY